jgi:hypothetical protein
MAIKRIIKVTIYIEEKLYKAYKIKAVRTNKTVSSLISDAMRDSLIDDLQDVILLRSRIEGEHEDYKEFLLELQKDGLI